jgi:hypothetical protein
VLALSYSYIENNNAQYISKRYTEGYNVFTIQKWSRLEQTFFTQINITQSIHVSKLLRYHIGTILMFFGVS